MESSKLTETARSGTTHQVPADLAARLVEGVTLTEIAEDEGVSRTTVRGWIKLPDVVAAVEELRQDLIDAARRKMSSKIGRAFDVYVEIMEDNKQPAAARIAAADRITERLLPTKRELELSGTVTSRIEELTDAEVREAREAAARALLTEVEPKP